MIHRIRTRMRTVEWIFRVLSRTNLARSGEKCFVILKTHFNTLAHKKSKEKSQKDHPSAHPASTTITCNFFRQSHFFSGFMLSLAQRRRCQKVPIVRWRPWSKKRRMYACGREPWGKHQNPPPNPRGCWRHQEAAEMVTEILINQAATPHALHLKVFLRVSWIRPENAIRTMNASTRTAVTLVAAACLIICSAIKKKNSTYSRYVMLGRLLSYALTSIPPLSKKFWQTYSFSVCSNAAGTSVFATMVPQTQLLVSST